MTTNGAHLSDLGPILCDFPQECPEEYAFFLHEDNFVHSCTSCLSAAKDQEMFLSL